MKTITFKFDINEPVTTIEGREGRIFEMRFGGGENNYIVNFNSGQPSQDYLLESELIAGHYVFVHERK